MIATPAEMIDFYRIFTLPFSLKWGMILYSQVARLMNMDRQSAAGGLIQAYQRRGPHPCPVRLREIVIPHLLRNPNIFSPAIYCAGYLWSATRYASQDTRYELKGGNCGFVVFWAHSEGWQLGRQSNWLLVKYDWLLKIKLATEGTEKGNSKSQTCPELVEG